MYKVLAFLLVTLFSGCIYPPTSPEVVAPPVTTPDISDEAPSEAMQVLVAPLKALGMDVKDAAKAASFFNAFADVVARDDSIIKTTADIREGYIRAETLMLQKTEMVGKYPGFGKAKDDVLTETLGLDRVSLTPEKRKETVDAFRAMAWALGG
jgi:hypothetical protein|tara:strand:+ start:1827 stop:2285 length:459 start_codon:yes stop_codon:yes gene_type:complete